jgi:hypothetical protein
MVASKSKTAVKNIGPNFRSSEQKTGGRISQFPIQYPYGGVAKFSGDERMRLDTTTACEGRL